MSDKRTIGGKVYRLFVRGISKSNARGIAKRSRVKGYQVRLIKDTGGYSIWRWHK